MAASVLTGFSTLPNQSLSHGILPCMTFHYHLPAAAQSDLLREEGCLCQDGDLQILQWVWNHPTKHLTIKTETFKYYNQLNPWNETHDHHQDSLVIIIPNYHRPALRWEIPLPHFPSSLWVIGKSEDDWEEWADLASFDKRWRNNIVWPIYAFRVQREYKRGDINIVWRSYAFKVHSEWEKLWKRDSTLISLILWSSSGMGTSVHCTQLLAEINNKNDAQGSSTSHQIQDIWFDWQQWQVHWHHMLIITGNNEDHTISHIWYWK